MTKVKRYDCASSGASHCYGCYTMIEEAGGDYVSAEDYDALLARTQAEWQPIETAPLDCEHPCYFLIHTSNQDTFVAMGMQGEVCYLTAMDGFTNNPDCYGVITHWMPLPTPPSKDEVK